MRYEYFYEPLAHLVITDFFTEDEYNSLFDLIKQIESKMIPGATGQPNATHSVNEKSKKALNFWPYGNRDNEESIKIIDLIEDKMWSEEMRKIYMESRDSMFQYYHKTNNSNIMISKYTKGSFYDWHFDLIKSVTGNIWLSKDNVEGGDLILKSVHGDVKEIKYKNNTCIFFPSECLHKVTEITNESERFSIQYWAHAIYVMPPEENINQKVG